MKKKSKIAFGRLDLLRNDTLNNKSKIRIGFIGGGPNSFIGYTHRLSARFDNKGGDPGDEEVIARGLETPLPALP